MTVPDHISVTEESEMDTKYECQKCGATTWGDPTDIFHNYNCPVVPDELCRLPEKRENNLFEAVCERYSLSYGLEDKQYFSYWPCKDDEKYRYYVQVDKWSAHSTKVHIGKARFDKEEQRWVIAYSKSSGWR